MKRTLRAKKLMSVLLLMVMLLSMLPAAYAEGGTEPVVIQVFTADVPLCAVIGEPCTGYKRDNPDEGYTAVGTWMTDGKAVAETDTFQENTSYKYHLVVKPREGYKLADGFTHDFGNGRGFGVGHPDKDGNYVNDFIYMPISQATGAKVIDELTVSLPSAPEAGAEARQAYGKKENEYFYNMYWYEDDIRLLDTQQFEANKVYSAKYEFETTNGCTFAEKVKINGLGKEPIYATRTDEATLTFSHNFPATGSAKPTPGAPVLTPVNSIELAGPKAPVTGEAIPAYGVDGVSFSAKGKWLVDGAEATETKFRPETEYTLAVTLTPAEGYDFSALQSVTLDGEKMTVTAALAAEGAVSFTKTYPKTGPESVAVARIVRDGKNVDFETFDAAFKDAKNGEEILLLTSCNTDAGINLDKNITASALEGLAEKPVLSFTAYGMALWGKSITFNNIDIVMNGIGSTPYGEWGWMTICGNANSEIILNNVNMLMDGQELNKHAIYADNGMHLVLNNSNLTIKNYVQDALEWNGGSFDYNVEMTNSHYVSDHNRSGFTGTFNVKTLNSTVDVINSRGNGSNGSNFYFTKSTVNFNDNGSHGLSAGNLSMDNSVVNANGNGGNGVHVTGTLTSENGTKLTINNNGCTIASKWTKPGALLLAGNGNISNSTVTITGNSGSGIHQIKEKSLVIDDTTALTVTNNKAVKLGIGGGIAAIGSVKLPANAVLYNNHAGEAGDDIALYGENAEITLGPVGSDWKLDGTEGTNDCLKAIDGWYRDEEEEADRPAPMIAAAGISSGRWNAHSLEKLFVEKVEPGTLTGPMFLKAAHGIREDKSETPSELKFVKTDSMTGKPIKGAEFTLYSDEALKTVKASYVSDEKGEFVISELPGSYYLKETKPAAGYRDNGTVYHVYIRPEIIEDKLLLDTTVTPNEVYSSVKSVSYGYVENMEPDSTGRYGITNDIINEKEIEIKKIWRDKEGMRARTGSVEIALYADKAEYEVFTLCDDNNWSMKLTVPKYDEMGREIKYTVKELTKVKDYNVSYDGLNVINTHRLYNPKTGDESNIWLWVGILTAAALAAGAVSYILIKKRKTDN